jgi:SARP family transcriptional regulator, regulator of embCAB operon
VTTRLVLVEQGPLTGREHPLIHDMTIGRQGCDLVLPDPEVSRRHALVIETGAGPAIEDLASTNGTFVNDRRIDGTQVLRAGDRLRLGNTVFDVAEADQGDSSPTNISRAELTPPTAAA